MSAREFYDDPAVTAAARAHLHGHGLINPIADRTPVQVRTSAQYRAAIQGREVKALPTATRRRVKRKVRRARKTVARHLAFVGGAVLLLLLVAVASAAFGYAVH